MVITVNKEKLEKLIHEEINEVMQFGCCTGTSTIGVFGGLRVHLVVTNDASEFMDLSEEPTNEDKEIVQWQE